MAGSRERARTAVPITHYRIILTKLRSSQRQRLGSWQRTRPPVAWLMPPLLVNALAPPGTDGAT